MKDSSISQPAMTMTRGRFLGVLSGALVLGSHAFAKAAATSELKAGCQTYTFRLFSLYEAIEKTAAAGGNSIELCMGKDLSPQDKSALSPDLNEAQVQGLVEQLKKNGIRHVGIYTDISSVPDKARKVFELAKKLGVSSLSTESVPALDTIEAMVKEYDIRVGFHNHARMVSRPEYKLWDPNYVKELVQGRDARIGSCSDTGHWATSGLNPLDCLRILDGRVINLHLKDRREIGRLTTDQIYGRGMLNVPAILTELKRQKFQGSLYVEYETNWEKNVPDVKECLEFLRKTSAS